MTDDQVVRDLLPPGETVRAVIPVSRADPRASVPLTRAEMSPFRFRRPADRHGAPGRPGSLAAGLAEHIRNVTDPRLLVRTDRRLLVLSRRRRSWRILVRPDERPGPRWRLRWECPGENLTAATERAGRLRLTFRDGSSVTLLTPSAGVRPFLTG